MKSVQKIDLGLTGYDELFMNDAERKENKLPRIYDIPLSEIDDFPDHPFKVKLDEDMDQLVQSIQYNGYHYYCRRESLAVAKTEETGLREMEKSKTNTEMYPG